MNVSIPNAIVAGTNLLLGYKDAVITFFYPFTTPFLNLQYLVRILTG
jgi:hypothetical protein